MLENTELCYIGCPLQKNPIVTLELKETNFHDFRHTNVN